MRKRGQVWVETVVYTLIALVLIGLVLTFIRPKITELQDKVILQQSISMLNNLDNVLTDLSTGGPGNKRKIEITIKSGSLTIDGVNDRLIFSMDSGYQFSEPGKSVTYGNIVAYDKVVNDLNEINMTLDYSSKYNITYQGKKISKTLTQSSTPYTLFISNTGSGGSSPNMDFDIG